jgi:hypothetical protein
MFALLRFFLALFSSLFKSKSRLEAENAALRRQVIVLQRKVRGRVHLSFRYTQVKDGKSFAATTWFAGGYLLAWLAFSLVATSAQWMLERATLLTPMMATANNLLGGIVLIAAGLYQWTPVLSENSVRPEIGMMR